MERRLRRQMRTDKLSSSRRSDEEDDDDDAEGGDATDPVILEPEFREKCLKFLGRPAPERLAEVIKYLRSKHHYCFWCGAQYKSAEEMGEQCPGTEEDDHD